MSVKHLFGVQVTDFVQRRLEQLLVDSGVCIEAVRAVVPQRGYNPHLAATSAHQLQVMPAGTGPLLLHLATLQVLGFCTRWTRGNVRDRGFASHQASASAT